MTNTEIARRLLRWANNRDRCNEKPNRHGKSLDSDLLRLAAERLTQQGGDMSRPHSIYEVHFICRDEAEERSISKWLSNYTEGMTILYAFTREYSEEDHESALMVEAILDEGGDE